MKRDNTQSLGEVLLDYIRALNIGDKLKEVEMLNSWEEIAGKNISRATSNIYIRKRVLFIHLNSSAARNELSMIKDELLKKLNEKAGEPLIEKIVLK